MSEPHNLSLEERVRALELGFVDSLQARIFTLNAAMFALFRSLGQGRTTKEDVADELRQLIAQTDEQDLSEEGRLAYQDLLTDLLDELTDPEPHPEETG